MTTAESGFREFVVAASVPGAHLTYAGIGSRETPDDVLAVMQALASKLEQMGWVLRTGGAAGADSAFAMATAEPGHREIFVPWAGFAPPEYHDEEIVVTDLPNYPSIVALAERFHPNWAACRAGARKLHSRNVLQILGRALAAPVTMVVCWTRDGKSTGGTGQALRIAEERGVPIFNLHNPANRASAVELLSYGAVS